ncbi:hypothetical protein J6590_057914 [Homalodisca vitripennis]|nr:hypothetical protein J6590_057914 [Homalodisca vitripennis]
MPTIVYFTSFFASLRAKTLDTPPSPPAPPTHPRPWIYGHGLQQEEVKCKLQASIDSGLGGGNVEMPRRR